MGIEVETKSKLLAFTPAITTAAYAVGDQVGDLKELTNAMDDSGDTGVVVSVTVVDKNSASAALDVLFFKDLPTVASADNVSLNITDAEMAENFLGFVRVATTDYITLAASSVATVKNAQLIVGSSKSDTNLTGKSIWCILRSAGTPTYSGVSDLVVTVGVMQD